MAAVDQIIAHCNDEDLIISIEALHSALESTTRWIPLVNVLSFFCPLIARPDVWYLPYKPINSWISRTKTDADCLWRGFGLWNRFLMTLILRVKNTSGYTSCSKDDFWVHLDQKREPELSIAAEIWSSLVCFNHCRRRVHFFPSAMLSAGALRHCTAFQLLFLPGHYRQSCRFSTDFSLWPTICIPRNPSQVREDKLPYETKTQQEENRSQASTPSNLSSH